MNGIYKDSMVEKLTPGEMRIRKVDKAATIQEITYLTHLDKIINWRPKADEGVVNYKPMRNTIPESN